MDSGSMQHLTISTSLFELLCNNLVLYQTAPYLSPASLLALGATSKSFRSLIHNTPGVFRHLDLTNVKSAKFELAAIDHGGQVWRNYQMDENVTEDDFYGGPLRGIINKLLKQKILQNVHTLILDGLSVTSDLLYDIIVQDSFSIRILSIREVKNLNEKKLRQALSYAVRPTRAENTPKLQALYIFGPRDPVTSTLPRRSQKIDYSRVATVPTSSIMHSQGAQIGAEWNQKSGEWLADNIEKQDEWYQSAGEVFIAREPPHAEWEATMRECEGIISFDAVLCRGPRHTDPVSETEGSPPLPWYKRQSAYLQPKAATCALEGCYGCGSAPEKFSEFGKSSLSQFPLLAPPPFHSSTQRACKVPFLGTSKSYFLARCVDCLRNRHCKSCHKWWCEECYEVPEIASTIRSFLQDSMTSPDGKKGHIKPGVIRDCFECGMNCSTCVKRTQLMCKVCGGGYCAIHNEGSSLTTCDWCSNSGRRTRELY